ncbi:hypothetical protein DENIS_3352 [Desulfonema ishimotonii]|uniref:Uncharacterized protein n=1 Tax=Desulfonema ishimotonii TaxID=45657 RepID=A0A401FZJ6_9BACT|nr:hypothetical protein DENIS_3352 [Desulfonema ishimotonii]
MPVFIRRMGKITHFQNKLKPHLVLKGFRYTGDFGRVNRGGQVSGQYIDPRIQTRNPAAGE